MTLNPKGSQESADPQGDKNRNVKVILYVIVAFSIYYAINKLFFNTIQIYFRTFISRKPTFAVFCSVSSSGIRGWAFYLLYFYVRFFLRQFTFIKATDPMVLAGILATKFLGSVLFAWLYVEWSYNIWVPIFLHSLMNASWYIFSTGTNALGDIGANVFRLLTVALAIALDTLQDTHKARVRNK